MKTEYQCSECFLVFAGAQGAADCHEATIRTRDGMEDLRGVLDDGESLPDLVDVLNGQLGDTMEEAFQNRYKDQ